MYKSSINYLENNINIIAEKGIANIFLKFIHKDESYLVFHCYHVMKPNLLILKLRDKKSLWSSTLFLALDEFKKGAYKYEVSSDTAKKIIK